MRSHIALSIAFLATSVQALAQPQGGALDFRRTAELPMVREAGGGTSYDIVPLLTAGDEIPLLVGQFPALVPAAGLTYTFPGTPDGMGVFQTPGSNWIVCQHEFDGVVGEPDDFQQTSFSRTFTGYVPGARISLIRLRPNWTVVGATLLCREFMPTTVVTNDDGSPRVAAGSSIEIDLLQREYRHDGFVPSSFCSGTLATTGFLNPANGAEEPVWFASEEDDGYSGLSWACFLDGRCYPLEGLGISEKEQTLPLRQHRPAQSGHTIIVASDDEDDGEVYLWVGTPTTTDPNGFVNGDLYVLKVPGAARESGPGARDGFPVLPSTPADAASVIGSLGVPAPVVWNLVPLADRVTGQGLNDFVLDRGASGLEPTAATTFLAPEDIDEDATVADRIYICANGGAYSEEWDDEDPRYENPFARIYQLDLNVVDPLDPSTWSSTITQILEGGVGKGMSYDNVAADSKGRLLLSEDLNKDTGEADLVWRVMKSERRAPVFTSVDLATGQAQILFELWQERHDPKLLWSYLDQWIAAGEEGEARDSEFWEGTGQVEVPSLSTATTAAYLLGVQASSLVPSGGALEGGQLLLARPRN